ncbi:MAG: F0F1 ATP synthase subunit B [Verrucomicrobia bacterium]|nr:F0F1 ATP synthase subunit B [Verrucomicrobiota bacterium]
MNSFILFANIGTELAQSARDTAEKFGLDAPHFIAQVILFIIVAGLLHRFAYHPILKVLEERRQRIAEGLANADRIKSELARTEAARQEVLNQANLQANRLIEEARAAAARVQEQETQRAIAAAELIIAKAREAAAQDHARMLAELRREIGQLVVKTTAQVTGKILTGDDQRRLIEETNRQLAA